MHIPFSKNFLNFLCEEEMTFHIDMNMQIIHYSHGKAVQSMNMAYFLKIRKKR